ncbi:MAG TPA: hypothetical protein VMC80_02200 [Patescibacteria group bacterium]|nr:hypothetical protein [Patescibacteria group bacterium]
MAREITAYIMNDGSMRVGFPFSQSMKSNKELLHQGCILHPQQLGNYDLKNENDVARAVTNLYPKTIKTSLLAVDLKKTTGKRIVDLV